MTRFDGWLTQAQMIEVDRVMIDDLGIGLIQMMENAGRHLAQLAIDRFAPTRAVIAAGSGGNGGGGMVAARHLANRGVDVVLAPTRPGEELSGVPARQRRILDAMGIPVVERWGPVDLIVDAVIGYSLQGAPTGTSRSLIDAINASDAPVLSLDTPSGLDVTTGHAPGAVVAATATLTLAAPKVGLAEAAEVGDLHVADISVPPRVLLELGAVVPDFSSSPIVAISR
ncbi:MAG: NAD(P)H-hydrate epimerase [Actinomycetota bacterium]